MRQNSILLVMALVLGTAILTAGAVTAAAADDIDDLSVDVAQDDDGTGTVSVTANDSGIANASVDVETVDNESYEGVGEYTTDENGTVDLPAPEENVTVAVTATVENESATTEATLTATEESEEETFGQTVSSFVNSLDGNETDGPMGQVVSEFVRSNNPAADIIPDNAGPGNETGPPEDAGPGNETGPPEDAGPGDDEDESEEDDVGGGPPDDAGP